MHCATHRLMDSREHRWCTISSCWCTCSRRNFGRSRSSRFVGAWWAASPPPETAVHSSSKPEKKILSWAIDQLLGAQTYLSILIGGIWWIEDLSIAFYSVVISRRVVVVEWRLVAPRLPQKRRVFITGAFCCRNRGYVQGTLERRKKNDKASNEKPHRRFTIVQKNIWETLPVGGDTGESLAADGVTICCGCADATVPFVCVPFVWEDCCGVWDDWADACCCCWCCCCACWSDSNVFGLCADNNGGLWWVVVFCPVVSSYIALAGCEWWPGCGPHQGPAAWDPERNKLGELFEQTSYHKESEKFMRTDVDK